MSYEKLRISAGAYEKTIRQLRKRTGHMRNPQKVSGAYENRNKSYETANKSYEKLRKVAGAYEKMNRSYEKNIHSALREGNLYLVGP